MFARLHMKSAQWQRCNGLEFQSDTVICIYLFCDLSLNDTFFFISRECSTFNSFCISPILWNNNPSSLHCCSLSSLWTIHLQTWTDPFLLIRWSLRPKGWARWRDIFITSSGGLAWTNENVNLCFDICLIGPSLLCVHWNQTKRLIQIIRITGPCVVDTFRHGNSDMHWQMGEYTQVKSRNLSSENSSLDLSKCLFYQQLNDFFFL